jgi:hypothetical protein
MADVDHLYALPLEEFTPARDAAAREIRKAGDRETAAVVAKLPKPTPAAWTANQVAREQPELIEAMLDAGAALREAQEAAVSGGGGQGLREATLAERAAVDALMTAASAHRPAGRALSRAVTDRLRTTLHAAAADESIREALAAGRLVSEAQAGGAWPFALEPGEPAEEDEGGKPRAAKTKSGAKAEAKAGPAKAKAGAAKPKAGAKAKRPKDDANATADREAAERAEREAAEQAECEAAETRKALEAQLRDARGSLRVRERVLAGAQEDAEQAKTAVTEADEALETAKRAADDAKSEAESAERVLAEATAALNEARDDVARLEERLD